MMALKTFSTEELYFVLDTNHAKELKIRFGTNRTTSLLEQVQKPSPQKIHPLSRSLFAAITEGPSCMLVILWSILGLVSLNVFALAIITIMFAVLLISTGTMFFHATYNELTRDNKRAIKQAQLAEVKLLCATEVYKRQRHELKVRHLPSVHLTEHLFAYHKDKPLKNLLPHLKKSLGAALMITPMIFGTYYFAMSGIFAAFGLTVAAAIMTGPIGISLAIVGSLAIGIYFGVKLYQACKQEETFNKRLKKTSQQFEYRRRICYEQRSKLAQGQSLDNKQEEEPQQVRKNSACTIRYTGMPALLVNKSPKSRKLLVFDDIYPKLGM